MFMAMFFFLVIIFSLLFLLLPLINGEPFGYEQSIENQNFIQEEARNLRQNLADVENEFKIGKISEKDYIRLKNEILVEWQKIYQKGNVTKDGQ